MSYYKGDYYNSYGYPKKHDHNKFDGFSRQNGRFKESSKKDEFDNHQKKDADLSNALDQDIEATQKAVALNGGSVIAPLTVGHLNFGVVIHVVIASAAINMATNNAHGDQENAFKVGTEEYSV
ncbi:hypothetical protein [Bacillus sp. T33-2]|uniref:hypothetical protein n=1 Tax=Bacillus sp. T33-2 TaxID=2054168 RepID=UPI000C77E108|nr:hypothetical protein [Bacillus sp. T33-2]PLR94797.1 hypothetical protein CVD19_16115 [Bacillus sp. T33-2]